MSYELVRYATGEVLPAKADRPVARQAKEVYDLARLQAMETDARMALASHIMQGVTKLDRQRKSLCSPEDTALHTLLCEIELEAFAQAREIQRRNSPLPAARVRGPWEF